MGYFRDTLKGVSWMGALRGVTRAIAYAKIAILARLLSPIEFGLFGVASIVLAFLEILTETGINALLIQEDSDLKDNVNSTWIVSIARGFLISLLILALSIPVANFFKSPEATRLIILISIVPFVRGFINPAIVKFQKELKFNKEFYLRLSLFFVDAAVSITLAVITRSAESLIWGMVAASILEVSISWLFVRPLPSLKFETERLRKVINRGKWITFAGIFDYLFHHIDDIVVGKIISTSSLGLYQVAYKISTLPITEGGEVISKVVFPVYVKISADRNRLKKAYLKVFWFITLLTIPFGILLILFAEPFVLLFLGEKWVEIVPVLKVLSVFGVVRAISGSSSALLLALKRQEYITLVTLVSIVGLVLPLLPLVKLYGLVGAAYASLLGALAALPVMYYYVRKELYEKGRS